AHELAEPSDAFGVESVDRLVEQQDPRIAEQGRGDAETLGHPRREPTGSLVAHRCEPDEVENGRHARAIDRVGRREGEQMILRASAWMERLHIEVSTDDPKRPVEIAVPQAGHERM